MGMAATLQERYSHFKKEYSRGNKYDTRLKQLPHEDRSKQCELTKLETRRIRGDQTEASKIMHGYEDADKGVFFKLKDKIIMRVHSKVFINNHCRLDVKEYAFSHRLVNLWNRLLVAWPDKYGDSVAILFKEGLGAKLINSTRNNEFRH